MDGLSIGELLTLLSGDESSRLGLRTFVPREPTWLSLQGRSPAELMLLYFATDYLLKEPHRLKPARLRYS
jgi:hypothetical protein